MAKRQSDDSTSITGFLDDVSPVKTSRNNTRYFNAVLQHQDEFHKVVCFNGEQHPMFTNAVKMKSPVKLTNIQKVPSIYEAGKLDIKIFRSSRLSIVDSVPFKKRKLDLNEAPSAKLSDLESEHQTVTISAKVLEVHQEPEFVEIYGSKKQKQEVIIADTTKSMLLTLWEEQISRVTKGECFTFKNVSTRKFNDEVKLTTTPKSSICPIPQMENITDTIEIKLPNQMVGAIVSVSVQSSKKCVACHKNIQEQYLGKIVTKCPHCSMKQKNSSLSAVNQCRINLQNENNDVHKFTAFGSTISSFLEKYNKSELCNMSEDLEDFLLMQEKVTVEYRKEIITKITILE